MEPHPLPFNSLQDFFASNLEAAAAHIVPSQICPKGSVITEGILNGPDSRLLESAALPRLNWLDQTASMLQEARERISWRLLTALGSGQRHPIGWPVLAKAVAHVVGREW